MAQPRVIEGTWDELAAHAEELRAYPKLTLIVPPVEETSQVAPNEKALAALREIARRQEGRRHTDGSQTERIIREGRAGAMYGDDPSE
jgi:hypothetical protein